MNKNKLLFIFSVMIFFLWGLCAGLWIAHGKPMKDSVHEYYALATKVVEINRVENVVTCEDCNGNLWQFTGVEDWEVDDNVNLLMDKCGTVEIYDDEICGTSYANWILSKS